MYVYECISSIHNRSVKILRSMPHDLPSACPLCEGAVFVTRIECPACAIAIEGRFAARGLAELDGEQLAFVEVFVRNRCSAATSTSMRRSAVCRAVDRLIGRPGPTTAHGGREYDQCD